MSSNPVPLMDKALSLLSYRAHSRKELADKLKRKTSCSEEELLSVLGRLEELGILNDENYAASVVRHAASKGYGKSRAVAELARRGIPKELWDDALSEMPESDETLDRLVQAKLHDPQDWDEVRKVSSSLIRRGYSWEEVRRAIDRACNDAIYEETDYDED